MKNREYRDKLSEPTSVAARQRKTRARRRNGLVPMHIDVHEHDTAEAMIRSGRLSEAQALRPVAVARELEKLVAEWSERWLPKG
jgi:hypothetical protein